MIKEIGIKNFKSLKDVTIITKPLTVLMGLNSTGKSSVIQTILLLRQSDKIAFGEVILNDWQYTEVGKGKDVMYQNSNEEVIKFSFKFTNQHPLEWNIFYNPEANVLKCEQMISEEILEPLYPENSWGNSLEDILLTKQKYTASIIRDHSIFNLNFQYLKSERSGPKSDYPASNDFVVNKRQIGVDGSYAINYLNTFGNEKVTYESLIHSKAKSNILLHQVDAWLGEISPGVKLNTTEIPGNNKFLLDFQFESGNLYTNRFNPKNVGFGLAYVLPVIVALLTVKQDKLLIIENPESHIHPKGQTQLGKLIALAAANGTQCIIETHSDHLLNGIRVAVRENNIVKKDVIVNYFERVTLEDEQFSKVTPIEIDKNGELSEYPKDFLDEWSNQLFKLI